VKYSCFCGWTNLPHSPRATLVRGSLSSGDSKFSVELFLSDQLDGSGVAHTPVARPRGCGPNLFVASGDRSMLGNADR
jgi:hypothetical protein